MSSASLQPLVIDDYLHTESAKGRVAGPFSSPLLPYHHISRFWVIPKKYQPGKWRLILDLSSPDGHTVNDGIRKGPFTGQYMKIDDIIDGIMSPGRDTLLAKFDVESAYRIIPIHLNDCYPKKHQPGKWRLILDLSSPDGHTVNGDFRKGPFTVQYMKMDDIDGIM